MAKTLAQMKKAWRRDPEFWAEYEAQEAEFEIARALIAARARAGLNQAQLAAKMGTTQSAIARIEGGRHLPSMKTICRYAEATKSRIRLDLEPA